MGMFLLIEEWRRGMRVASVDAGESSSEDEAAGDAVVDQRAKE